MKNVTSFYLLTAVNKLLEAMYTEETRKTSRKGLRYRVGSGCAAYGHMYQTINQKSKEDIYRSLTPFTQ
jgi:hypothetical protein